MPNKNDYLNEGFRLFLQKGMIAEAEKEMAISHQLSSENS
jgi:hypothetical protein